MSLSICKQIANLIQLIFCLLLAKNLKCVESSIFNVLNYAKVCIQADQSWDQISLSVLIKTCILEHESISFKYLKIQNMLLTRLYWFRCCIFMIQIEAILIYKFLIQINTPYLVMLINFMLHKFIILLI